jgi:ribosome-associated toxin RatA of RatAB toxin-antitoxin module
MPTIWTLVTAVMFALLGLSHAFLAPRNMVNQRLVRTGTTSLSASTSFKKDSYVSTGVVEKIGDGNERNSIILPELSVEDLKVLLRGDRVQKQERSGSRGEGIVVVDVNASPDVVFSHLSRFDAYQSMIPTVRKVDVLSITPRGTEAEFRLSKFGLKVNVLHTINAEDRTIKFRLNPNRVNPVFSEAAGFWHVEAPEDRPEGYSRVYLNACIRVSRFVPPFILDYASSKALPRASTWIRPYFEESLMEWSM